MCAATDLGSGSVLGLPSSGKNSNNHGLIIASSSVFARGCKGRVTPLCLASQLVLGKNPAPGRRELFVPETLTHVTDDVTCRNRISLLSDAAREAIPGSRGRVRRPRAGLQPALGRHRVLSAWHYDQAAMASLDWDRYRRVTPARR